MRLKTVFIRFYKSFNFDYLRKYHPGAKKYPWGMIGEMWYPYVRIPIEAEVTTVVGANECGKTHLLTAIEKGVSGADIERQDFCRYSQFYAVERGKRKWPNFGFEWDNLSEEERKQVGSVCGVEDRVSFDRFLFFRSDNDTVTVYLPNGDDYIQHELKKNQATKIQKLLPHVFRINAEIALPDTVPIRKLAGKGSSRKAERIGREGRFSIIDAFLDNQALFASQESIAKQSARIFPVVSEALGYGRKSNDTRKWEAETKLAQDLLCKVANIDPDALWDLYEALRDGKEGHANGIVQLINQRLADCLNFPRWWIQDKKFQLVVSAREFDLVFTIRDRTETDYSFSERSEGLKYFLSYYVQYRSHEPHSELPEILLMDEPDAYLSNQGQQDLLKIFEAFANPDNGRKPVQVIYVTHSPFLIDKNHAERIRVLEKGVTDEGTRVVRDAARNHYEPLRSAFGAFVGETTFIGNSNLMVEGPSDQILLAGAATFLRSRGASKLETLDLNNVTIVPAGNASSIPYMVYLARGRDVEQPAVTVLLDSDQAGNNARKDLKRGGPRRRQLLEDEFILQIGDLADEATLDSSNSRLIEIEDLIPLAICEAAVRKYVVEVCGVSEEKASGITASLIEDAMKDVSGGFKAIQKVLSDVLGDEYHIEKVGFARGVIDAVYDFSRRQKEADAVEAFESNMKVLLRRINKIMRDAERELSGERIFQKLERLKKSFLQDHPTEARREDAHILFEDIEASLEDNKESDEIKLGIAELRRKFNTANDITQPIEDYDEFREALEALKYAGRIATQNNV